MSEALMCQGDAMDCLAEGRYHAKAFFEKLAREHAEQEELLKKTAKAFGKVYDTIHAMAKLLGGWKRGEDAMRKLMDPDIRAQICDKIDQAKQFDEKALVYMKEYLRV